MDDHQKPIVELDAPDPGTSPQAEDCRASLEAVLGSKTFRVSDGQKAFLRYVAEAAIECRPDRIKEYNIGMDVFARGSAFDPRLDPIVRVMARKLRAGLARYYAAEGAADPLVIELPKGSYVPIFSPRTEVAPQPDEVTAAPLSVPDQPPAHEIALPRPSVHPSARTSIQWISVASLAVVLTAVLSLVLFEARSRGASAYFEPSVGVLPFTAISDGHDEESVADDLTEGLIESLSRMPGIRVAASASSFQFKGKTLDLREAGEKLQAHALLEGMVRKSHGRIHLTVQLVNAGNGYKLWSESYDRGANELPALEREVAQSILSAVGVADGQKHPRMDKVPTDAAAYSDYLQGRRLWSELSITSVTAAIHHFERAIAKDPTLAVAYAGLANCYAMIPQLTDARTPAMNARVRSAANKALELDSALGEAHAALGIAAAYEHEWALAEQEYRIGLALNPDNPVGHLWFGGYLSMVGKLDEAIVQRRMAAQLDPLSPYALEELARTYFHARRYDDAIRHYRQALSLAPGFGLIHQGLGRVYLQKGMYREGIDELLIANRILGPTPRRKGFLAYAYAISGRQAEARQILNEFLESSHRGPFPAIVIADVYLGLGDEDQALQWLEKVVAQKDIFTKSDPLYDPVRNDSRFTALVRRMNL